jgi:hypothetical protein
MDILWQLQLVVLGAAFVWNRMRINLEIIHFPAELVNFRGKKPFVAKEHHSS